MSDIKLTSEDIQRLCVFANMHPNATCYEIKKDLFNNFKISAMYDAKEENSEDNGTYQLLSEGDKK